MFGHFTEDAFNNVIKFGEFYFSNRTSLIDIIIFAFDRYASIVYEMVPSHPINSPIDKFVKDHKIKNIDFIKIDVEGHEYEILEGAKNSIKKFKPIIQSEFNYITRLLSKKNYKNYLEFAKKYNYRIMLLGKGYKIINKPNLNKISKYKFSDFIFF